MQVGVDGGSGIYVFLGLSPTIKISFREIKGKDLRDKI